MFQINENIQIRLNSAKKLCKKLGDCKPITTN